jgi:serine/threonine-protein kinase
MDKDPARRYPSAAALAEAARSALTGKPAQAVRPAAARVAFLGHDTPPTAPTSRATEPPAAATAGHGSGTVVPTAKARRRWPVVAALAVGVVIGAVWGTASVLSAIADDVEAQTRRGARSPAGRPAVS